MLKLGFLSVFGSSAGIRIERLGLEFDRLFEPLDDDRDIRSEPFDDDRRVSRTVSADLVYFKEPLPAACIAAVSDGLLAESSGANCDYGTVLASIFL